MLNRTSAFEVKYGFPPYLKIHQTNISCGLRMMSGITYAFSPYKNIKEYLFGITFFSKYPSLRHDYKPGDTFVTYPTGKPATVLDPGTVHTIIDKDHGYVVSSQKDALDKFVDAIKELEIGKTYITDWFCNRHYTHTEEGGSKIAVAVWFWNGNVPSIKQVGIQNFPFNEQGVKNG